MGCYKFTCLSIFPSSFVLQHKPAIKNITNWWIEFKYHDLLWLLPHTHRNSFYIYMILNIWHHWSCLSLWTHHHLHQHHHYHHWCHPMTQLIMSLSSLFDHCHSLHCSCLDWNCPQLGLLLLLLVWKHGEAHGRRKRVFRDHSCSEIQSWSVPGQLS